MIFDPLTFFGLCAVTAMLVFYALEDRSHWFILAIAGACVLGSVYGFLQRGMAVRGRRSYGPSLLPADGSEFQIRTTTDMGMRAS
jgi:hypothetical protein